MTPVRSNRRSRDARRCNGRDGDFVAVKRDQPSVITDQAR
jgi:hypothetical protein